MRTGDAGQMYGPNESDVAKLQAEIERLKVVIAKLTDTVLKLRPGMIDYQRPQFWVETDELIRLAREAVLGWHE